MTLKELKIKIGTKDVAAFVDKRLAPCYIPEKATTLIDVYSCLQLYEVCEEWLENNKWYVVDAQTLTEHLFYNIEGEFPEDWLEGLTDENNE